MCAGKIHFFMHYLHHFAHRVKTVSQIMNNCAYLKNNNRKSQIERMRCVCKDKNLGIGSNTKVRCVMKCVLQQVAVAPLATIKSFALVANPLSWESRQCDWPTLNMNDRAFIQSIALWGFFLFVF